MSAVCCKAVWGDGSYRPHVCGNAAKFEVDGKHYCGIHNPNKAKTKAQVEAEENYALRAKKYKLESAAPDLLEALQGFIEGAESMGWCTEKARAAIAKATGAAT